jgi:hypothetical protein
MMQRSLGGPLFEPFLTWLYQQDLADLDKLPDFVEIDEKIAPFSMAGYRRPGPEDTTTDAPAEKKRDKKKDK